MHKAAAMRMIKNAGTEEEIPITTTCMLYSGILSEDQEKGSYEAPHTHLRMHMYIFRFVVSLDSSFMTIFMMLN